jgi:hypothetical protein
MRLDEQGMGGEKVIMPSANWSSKLLLERPKCRWVSKMLLLGLTCFMFGF